MGRSAGNPGAPDELLTDWALRLPRGRVLDLGAGRGEAATWLASQGFQVEAVERDRRVIAALRRLAKAGEVRVHESDVRSFEFPIDTYVLILALALLHFLPVADRRLLAAQAAAALCPGGLIIARAFVDAPAGIGRPGRSQRAGEASMSASEFHPLGLRELPELFPTLEVELYESYRLLDADSWRGVRSGAALVARRPPGERV